MGERFDGFFSGVPLGDDGLDLVEGQGCEDGALAECEVLQVSHDRFVVSHLVLVGDWSGGLGDWAELAASVDLLDDVLGVEEMGVDGVGARSSGLAVDETEQVVLEAEESVGALSSLDEIPEGAVAVGDFEVGSVCLDESLNEEMLEDEGGLVLVDGLVERHPGLPHDPKCSLHLVGICYRESSVLLPLPHLSLLDESRQLVFVEPHADSGVVGVAEKVVVLVDVEAGVGVGDDFVEEGLVGSASFSLAFVRRIDEFLDEEGVGV